MKKFLIFFIIIILLCFVVYRYLEGFMNDSLQAVDVNDNTEIALEIPSGSTTTTIAQLLYDNGLIKNVNVFKYYAKKEGYDSKLKAGSFTLKKSMSVEELLDALVNKAHSNNTINLTIIEGLILEDTAKAISEQLSLDYNKIIGLMKDANYFRDKHEFLKDNPNIKDLQGYLLPETYNLYIGMSEEEVIDFLLTQFDNYYEDSIKPYLNNLDLSFEEIIILSSIVEKEAVVAEERPIIAGVFINRLNIGMKLQSCATVNYARGEWKDRLDGNDIQIDSPYNTYLYEGLPPTPINSPGVASIDAVIHSEDVDYMYFVAKGDGSHHFSVTYDEHMAAVQKYLGD